jgi:hypothetical protein
MDSSTIPILLTNLSIWRWQDVFEIFFFTGSLYYLSRWLARHINKKLLVTLYSYCTCIIVAYFLELTLVYSFLITTAPIACMLLILMHQETIQRNFIVAQRIVPAPSNQQWIEALMQCCMKAGSGNKDVFGVIQRNDDVSTYLKTNCPINALIHKDLLFMIMQSPLFEHGKLLWLRSNGSLVGINSSWQQFTNKILPDSLHPHADWQEMALAISAKTDVLVFKSDHTTNSFSIILNGVLAEKITAHNCVKLIGDYIQEMSFSQREQLHDQKKSTNQPPVNHS